MGVDERRRERLVQAGTMLPASPPDINLAVGPLLSRMPCPHLDCNVSTTEVMRFNAAPELVNGRLAMVGMLVAARNEVLTGQTVMQQFASAPLLSYLAFGVLVYASLVPMLKGARHEAFGEPVPGMWPLGGLTIRTDSHGHEAIPAKPCLCFHPNTFPWAPDPLPAPAWHPLHLPHVHPWLQASSLHKQSM
jgi:Chlorophyll A-B binding protein